MSEWKKMKLGDYIDVLSGFAFKSKDFSDSGIPVIKIKNVCPPYISLEDLSYVPNSIAFQNPRYILRKGDVLIAMTGSHINQIASVVGRVGRVRYDAITVLNQRVGKIVNKNEAKSSLDYIYYYLSQYEVKVELAQKAGGAANQANISPSDIKNLLFPYPPMEVQHRIATILSRYDSLIENYQKQIKLLEEAAQRLYKEWFVDLHFPGHENTKIIDGVPEGWEYRKIGDVYKTVLGGTPSRAKSNYWGGDIPWINSGEINKLRIIQASEMITQEGYDNSSTKLMPVHTTILAITGATLGQVSYTEIETCANQSVVGIIDETNQTNEYLYLYINDNILSIVNKATGGAQQHINKDIVNDYNILIPVQNVLALFKERTTPLFKLIKDYLNSIQSLTEARDRLLPKLMNEEIKV